MSQSNPFEEFDPFRQGDENKPEACLVCEALCPDAVDGTLSEVERLAFEKHVAACTHCAQELEDAQRGAAWLGLLKSKAPEPPATLLARILEETSGVAEGAVGALHGSAAQGSVNTAQGPAPNMAWETDAQADIRASAQPETQAGEQASGPSRGDAGAAPHGLQIVRKKAQFGATAAPLAAGGLDPAGGRKPGTGQKPGAGQNPTDAQNNLLSFRRKLRRIGGFAGGTGGPALDPRLAMTAAMAFFSIALTLNLTGVQLRDFHAEKLQPSALQRTAAAAEASAVRSFQNLKVVYQVESRVSELRQDPLWEAQDGSKKTVIPAKEQDPEKTTGDRGQD